MAAFSSSSTPTSTARSPAGPSSAPSPTLSSGGGCNNTGEIADVMQHEWGHGLDNNTQGGDSATGEGTADHVAFILQHHPVIGPYFRTSGAGVRDLDKDNNTRGLVSADSGDGCGEAVLAWSAALETCSVPVVYNVYRSTTAGFSPSQETLLAQSTDLSLVDAGLDPKVDYHYVVHAVDQAQLSDGDSVEQTATATILAEIISAEDFESGAAGWAQSGTNDASTGLWELGDPVKTDAQPGDCPSGASCWATGLTGPGLGDNDIDGGTTTLLSEPFSLTGTQAPAIRYQRYYSNNTGATPGTDIWQVDISSDDGSTWESVENTQDSDTDLIFRLVEFALPGSIAPTGQMRVRFIASDLGEGSLVEAVVDDFQTVDLDGGCDDCAAAPELATILVTRAGDDVILDWTANPAEAGRFKVYTLGGADFSGRTLLGTTTTKSYRHIGGAIYVTLTSYRVTAVNACGEEGL